MILINKNDDGSLIISDSFTNKIEFEAIGTEYVYTIYMLKDILTLPDFSYIADGELNTKLLEVSYTISPSNQDRWGSWVCLEQTKNNKLPDVISPDKYYDLKIKWIRVGSSTNGTISLKSFKWQGTYQLNETNTIMNSLAYGQSVIVKPDNVYKIFKITDVVVTTKGVTDNAKLDIQYRFTQNKDIYWSKWEYLTKENITTIKITPIKFIWFEFKITRTGTEQSGYVAITDINLIGDIQNVTADSKKTNLFSLRDCCKKSGFGATNIDTLLPMQSAESCEIPDIFTNISSDAEAMSKLFNPYNLKKESQIVSALNTAVNQMFGVSVVYFATSPDSKGIDYTFHEYQLYNMVAYGDIKITVDKNQFPDNQPVFSIFDMGLFESFEIQISKEMFKSVFGVEKRPTKEDFLYLCDLSRMYQVEHAYAFRDFNNTSTYYKIHLIKFNQKSNVIPQTDNIKDMVNNILGNSTLNDIFSTEIKNDKKNIAFKPELSTLSKDLVRYQFAATINPELIENSDMIVATRNYDMNHVIEGESNICIKYFNSDSYVRKGDNRAFTVWFKFTDYVVNENYNLITNYNATNNTGYKINIYNDNIIATLNDTDYVLNISDVIVDNVWYCYLVNMDQRDRKIHQYLYTRNVDNDKQNEAKNLNSTVLKLIRENDIYLEPIEFEFDNTTTNLVINKSGINLTNIKLYNVTIDKESHTKILNQNIVRESEYIILCDICNRKVTLTNYPYN